ncbi:hypothetical protein FJQ98_15865 [Lysinibacillus agricola]|uniref:DNA helicase n=1 Tax=Lysinibacillus agricola TaxID=2590012 RepID=A0ABX7ALG0_9BACI|nr:MULTISPECIES: hypothetical protein [Lysinibacillus]KOS60386.1 hypothetical protein AN161_23700 [Lysinibacillus sp. FJAT-14222]QQP10723.1 hypothetical protein FJQ98_15865 [Lysinibacillus agricola]
MKNILVIAENSKVIQEVINQVKLNVPREKLYQVSSSRYEAEITGADFKLRVVLKDSKNDEFAYDEIYEYTFNSLLEVQLFGAVKALVKRLSPEESPITIIGQFISKFESENPVKVKKEFNISSIPLQLLTKVDTGTTNKEIDYILSTIRSINNEGFYITSKEGSELSRIESLLEDRIKESLKDGDYKTLESSVRLLQRIKDAYRKVKLSCSIG